MFCALLLDELVMKIVYFFAHSIDYMCIYVSAATWNCLKMLRLCAQSCQVYLEYYHDYYYQYKAEISGDAQCIFLFMYIYLALHFLCSLCSLTSLLLLISLLPLAHSCIFYYDVQALQSTCVFACLLRFG